MSSDETLALRADQVIAEAERERRQQNYQSFDDLYELVEAGELTLDQLRDIQLKLGPVAVIKTVEKLE